MTTIPNLGDLARLAREAQEADSEWLWSWGARKQPVHDFIAAASPAVVVGLVRVAMAADELRKSADMKLTKYSDGKAYVSYDPHGFGLLVGLMEALAALQPGQPSEATNE